MTSSDAAETTVEEAFASRRALVLGDDTLMINDLDGTDLGMRGAYSRFSVFRDRRTVRLEFGRDRVTVDLGFELTCTVEGDHVRVPKVTSASTTARLRRFAENRQRYLDVGYFYDRANMREDRMFVMNGWIIESLDSFMPIPQIPGVWLVRPVNLPRAGKSFSVAREDEVTQLSPSEYVVHKGKPQPKNEL